jgi:hypothetical protein
MTDHGSTELCSAPVLESDVSHSVQQIYARTNVEF